MHEQPHPEVQFTPPNWVPEISESIADATRRGGIHTYKQMTYRWFCCKQAVLKVSAFCTLHLEFVWNRIDSSRKNRNRNVYFACIQTPKIPRFPVFPKREKMALQWHSRGQRFDPAYLHQEKAVKCFRKSPETLGFRDFFLYIGRD